MRVENILGAFAQMQRPLEPDALAIQPLAANAKLAVRSDGSLALFFKLPIESGESTRQISKCIDVVTSQDFQVWHHGEKSPRPAPGVLVMLREPALNWYFAAIANHVGSVLRADEHAFETYDALDGHLTNWLELFSVEQLSIERAVGMWGELAIVLQFSNIDRGVAAWVGPLGEPFDFVANGLTLELKTTIVGSTVWFSLKQLLGKEDGYALHLRTLRNKSTGRSLDDLVSLVRGAVEDDADFLYKLGNAGYRPGDHSELKLTLEETRAVPLRDVPRPSVADSRIGSVRFEVDFDSLAPSFVSAKKLLETCGEESDGPPSTLG
jgi:Putative  PD-(D/E)XK family member, (DUF4420)